MVSVSHVPLLSSLPPASVAGSSTILATPVTAVVPSQWSTGPLLQTSSGDPGSGSLPNFLSAPPAGLTLSPVLGIIPHKLVEKARLGSYIEMREFLRDNILLLEQLETLQGSMPQLSAIPGSARPRLRDVTSPLAWVHCFLTYMGACTSDPTTRSQAAYACLILMEAQRHGGRGWLEYDKAFRRQAAGNSSLRWDIIDQGIQASTINNRGLYCNTCNQTDHTTNQCALSFFQPPASMEQGVTPPSQPSGPEKYRTKASRSGPYRREMVNNICISWNKGRCHFPGKCVFRHICASCQAKHMAKDCPVTATSLYRQPPVGPTRPETFQPI